MPGSPDNGNHGNARKMPRWITTHAPGRARIGPKSHAETGLVWFVQAPAEGASSDQLAQYRHCSATELHVGSTGLEQSLKLATACFVRIRSWVPP